MSSPSCPIENPYHKGSVAKIEQFRWGLLVEFVAGFWHIIKTHSSWKWVMGQASKCLPDGRGCLSLYV
jgi:hypothetical protein